MQSFLLVQKCDDEFLKSHLIKTTSKPSFVRFKALPMALFWALLVCFQVHDYSAEAQVNLRRLANYSLFVSDTLKSDFDIQYSGRMAVGGVLDVSLTNVDSVFRDSVVISDLNTDFDDVRLDLLNLQLTNPPDTITNLAYDTLSYGNYYVNGNLNTLGSIFIDPRDGYPQTVIHISGDLIVDNNCFIELTQNHKIYWVVDGDLIINATSGLQGTFLVSGKYKNSGAQIWANTLFCRNSIKLDSALGNLKVNGQNERLKNITAACIIENVPTTCPSLINDGGFEQLFGVGIPENCTFGHLGSLVCDGVGSNSCGGLGAIYQAQASDWEVCLNNVFNQAFSWPIAFNTYNEPLCSIFHDLEDDEPNHGPLSPILYPNDPNPDHNIYAFGDKLVNISQTNQWNNPRNAITQVLNHSIIPGRTYNLTFRYYVGSQILATRPGGIQLGVGFAMRQRENNNSGFVCSNNPANQNIPQWPFAPGNDVNNHIFTRPVEFSLSNSNYRHWITVCEQFTVDPWIGNCGFSTLSMSAIIEGSQEDLDYYYQNNGFIAIDDIILQEVNCNPALVDSVCIGDTLYLDRLNLWNLGNYPTNGNFTLLKPIADPSIISFLPNGERIIVTTGTHRDIRLVYNYTTTLCPDVNAPQFALFDVHVRPNLEFDAGLNIQACADGVPIQLEGSHPRGIWSIHVNTNPPVFTQVGNSSFFNPANAVIGTNYWLRYGPTASQCGIMDSIMANVRGSRGFLRGDVVCLDNTDPGTANRASITFIGEVSPNATYSWGVPGNPITCVTPIGLTGNGVPPTLNVHFCTEGVHTVTLTINVPGRAACNRTYTTSVIVNPSQQGICCAPDTLFYVKPGGYANPNANAQDRLGRAILGEPNQLTTIHASPDGQLNFNGVYLIRGPILLSKHPNSVESTAEISISPGTIFYFQHNGEFSKSLYNQVQIDDAFPYAFKRGHGDMIFRNALIVNDFVNLSLQGCTLKGYCNEMWQGIFVLNRATLSSNSLNGKNPLISDAMIGVSVLGDYEYQLNPWFGINSTTFRNNIIGVMVNNRTNNASGSFIRNCRFLSNPSQMLRPYHANNGSQYNGIAGIHIRGKGWYNNSNYFYQLPAVKDLEIRNNMFENHIFGISGIGNGIDSVVNDTFNLCHKAGITNLDIDNSPFIDVSFGTTTILGSGEYLTTSNCKFYLPSFNRGTWQPLNFYYLMSGDPDGGCGADVEPCPPGPPYDPRCSSFDPPPNPCNQFRLRAEDPIVGIRLLNASLRVFSSNQFGENSIPVEGKRYHVSADVNAAPRKSAIGFWVTQGFTEYPDMFPVRPLLANGVKFENLTRGVRHESTSFGNELVHQVIGNELSGCQTCVHIDEHNFSSQASDLHRVEGNFFELANKGLWFFYDGNPGMQAKLNANQNRIKLTDTTTFLEAGESGVQYAENMELRFRCNDLRNANSNTKIGLLVGPGVRFKLGAIGSNGTNPVDEEVPNGNIFPIATGNRTQLPACADPLGITPFDVECTGLGAWTVRSTYTAIHNNSSYGIRYHRFGNEWVGNVVGSVNKDISSNGPNKILARTSPNQSFPNLDPDEFVVIDVCEIFDGIVFPDEDGVSANSNKEVPEIHAKWISEPIPNPAESHVLFNFVLPDQEKVSISIVSVLGNKESLQENFAVSGQSGSFKLDISSLAQGVYYCSFRTTNGWVATRKLIVSR